MGEGAISTTPDSARSVLAADLDVELDDRADTLETTGFVECVTGPAVGSVGLGCEVVDFNENDSVDLWDLAAYQRVFILP